MDPVESKRAWERLSADIFAGGPLKWGGMTRGGAMLESERILGPRAGDYGAAWVGEGLEATAQLSIGGEMYFNRNFHTGRTWIMHGRY